MYILDIINILEFSSKRTFTSLFVIVIIRDSNFLAHTDMDCLIPLQGYHTHANHLNKVN